jgi:hypothetical protein
MAYNSGSEWLNQHWSPDYLPNNEWVAATGDGIIAHNESLDSVIYQVKDKLPVEDVTFAYITFDIWQ